MAASGVTGPKTAQTGAVDLFIKITAQTQGWIKGESGDAKHKDEIDVHSYTWGVKNSIDPTTGLAVGKRRYSVLKFLARSQASTPGILRACCTNETLKTVVLTCRKAGGKQVEYMTWTLTNAHAAEVNSGYLVPDDITPYDEVSLTFQKIELDYKPQKADGSLGAGIMFMDDWPMT